MSDRQAPRRFYTKAEPAPREGGHGVLLDGRPLRTPAKAAFLAPTRALAEICAREWDAQGPVIDPTSMPVTRLVNVALDWTRGARDELVGQVAKFGETDLLCHRAATPRALVARETEIWDPLLAWARGELGAHLVKVIGVLPQTQPPETLAALERAAAALDDFRLTGLAHAAGLAGSAIIAFALERRAIEADAAFEAAALDELHQIATWGEDREARRRLEHLRCELAALAGYFAALA